MHGEVKRDQARELRSQGRSLTWISDELDVPRATITRWTRGLGPRSTESLDPPSRWLESTFPRDERIAGLLTTLPDDVLLNLIAHGLHEAGRREWDRIAIIDCADDLDGVT